MKLGSESIRAPLGRPLLCVSQQGSLGELLLGQHEIVIGPRRCRTSVRAARRSVASSRERRIGFAAMSVDDGLG